MGGTHCLGSIATPTEWEGSQGSPHPHLLAAIFLGAAIIAGPILLGRTRPGAALTRHVIAASQMLISMLAIHVSGGRIETHFHIFGALAFLAFYRDVWVLVTATVVIAVGHLFGNYVMPLQFFGTATPGAFRWVEHAAWVLFEDFILIRGCLGQLREKCAMPSTSGWSSSRSNRRCAHKVSG